MQNSSPITGQLCEIQKDTRFLRAERVEEVDGMTWINNKSLFGEEPIKELPDAVKCTLSEFIKSLNSKGLIPFIVEQEDEVDPIEVEGIVLLA